MAIRTTFLRVAALSVVAASLAGCGSLRPQASLTDRECMARVMYFESNRSSDEGMMAVGTVVMNRVQDHRYPKTVCGVVGQPNQFAEGALTKPVHGSSWSRAMKVADAVLSGQRHSGVGAAKFFHTAGYKFPYRNMHYVALAGGNIFYEKKNPAPGTAWPSATMFASRRVVEPVQVAMADERPRETVRPRSILLAKVETPEPRIARDAYRDEPPGVRFQPYRVAEAPRPLRPEVDESPRPPLRAPLVLASAPRAEPKAKPIVVAMLSPPERPRRKARSIEELIAMDLSQQ